MQSMSIIQQKMKEMLDHHSNLKDINLEDTALPKEQNRTTNMDDIMAKTPLYLELSFNLAQIDLMKQN